FGFLALCFTHLRSGAEQKDPDADVRLKAAGLNSAPITEEGLERYVRILTDDIGERHLERPEALSRAAIWIESTLKGGNMGYQVEKDSYYVGKEEVVNLVAELPGKRRRKEVVVIGVHYDTVPDCPGANSNATGVSVLLSLARAYAGQPQERTIRFVFFANGEAPFLGTKEMGSYVYAQRCRERKDNIVAMLSVESLGCFKDGPNTQSYPPVMQDKGFPSTGDFLAFIGSTESRYLADSARAVFMQSSDMPAISGGFPETAEAIESSDHQSFWGAGYPAIMVTDTAQYRYEHHNSPADTPDKIDLSKLFRATEGLESVVRQWSNPR
ncbi:MAG: M28 family peptidase, partial [Verrucomicrobiota bacterium]